MNTIYDEVKAAHVKSISIVPMLKRKCSPSSSSSSSSHEEGAANTKKLHRESISKMAEENSSHAFLFGDAQQRASGQHSTSARDANGAGGTNDRGTTPQRIDSPLSRRATHVAPSSAEASSNAALCIATPHRNDVLIGSGCETFHHVGNRRFRILVEINFQNYFKENVSSCHRDGIVRDVISSVRGNHPPGRFLVPHDEPRHGSTEAAGTTNWKIASRAEAEAKVHSTFLAAGRFLVTQATLLQEQEDDKEEAPVVQDIDTNQHYHEHARAANSISSSPTTDETGSQSSILTRQLSDPRSCSSATAAVKCPSKIRDFLTRPLSQYFVLEPPDTDGLPSPPPSYIVPSNYDILCGQNSKDYFHHIGNRRFRILIEMSLKRYETLLLHPTDDSRDSIQKLVAETLLSVSKCDPPGRFLGMDFSTGRWRILNPIFAQSKTEQTFFECMRVTQRKREQCATMERHDDVVVCGEEEANDLNAPGAASTADLQSALSTLFAFPCHSFGFGIMNPMDLSALQNQSIVLQRNVGHVAASTVSPSLTDLSTLQNVSADECLSHSRHGFYSHKMKPHGEKARSESADMMDVVGGMLQLGQSHRRSSV
ncbi:hypothetical protein ACHAW6_005156 [Cyclotella cf. meneghiniana]